MPSHLLATAFGLLAGLLPAQQSPAPRAAVDPAGVRGARILAGGGRLPAEIVARFLELAGAGAGVARIVLIPTAGASYDAAEARQALLERWRAAHPGLEFTLLHTRDRGEADREDFTAPLRAATGVWLGGGQQRRLAAAYLGTRVERELHALLDRGGVIGGTSAGTAIQTRTMIQSGMAPPVIATGFDFVPGAIADQHFLKRERLPRLRLALAEHPGRFGLGIDEGTAVEIRGRRLRVLGASKALLVLPAGAGRPERIVELGAGEHADLVSWQRAARGRAASPWPGDPMAPPRIEAGALVIAGGGALSPGIIDRFVELAGGDRARIVMVPAATPRGGGGWPESPLAADFTGRGAEVRVLDCAHPGEVTAAALAVLDDATAVWFGGGRQWRLCDAFEDTAAIAAFHAVLARGGVIGGSSAGATIQGEFLVRGDPLGNTVEWCEGYERGFAFLPGCAIDQHFLTRDRTRDLQALIQQLPQLIGLGVDEGTAAIVRGDVLEVVGASKVAVLDMRAREATRSAGLPEPVWLAPGDRWDLPRGARR